MAEFPPAKFLTWKMRNTLIALIGKGLVALD